MLSYLIVSSFSASLGYVLSYIMNRPAKIIDEKLFAQIPKLRDEYEKLIATMDRYTQRQDALTVSDYDKTIDEVKDILRRYPLSSAEDLLVEIEIMRLKKHKLKNLPGIDQI